MNSQKTSDILLLRVSCGAFFLSCLKKKYCVISRVHGNGISYIGKLWSCISNLPLYYYEPWLCILVLVIFRWGDQRTQSPFPGVSYTMNRNSHESPLCITGLLYRDFTSLVGGVKHCRFDFKFNTISCCPYAKYVLILYTPCYVLWRMQVIKKNQILYASLLQWSYGVDNLLAI